MSSTMIAAMHWSTQHEHAGPEWCQTYWDSRVLESRKAVIGQLAALPTWSTLVELGCHAGPMLDVIQREFPMRTLKGIEINPIAAAAARTNLPNVEIMNTGMTSWLATAPKASVDVIVSHYALAYVAPEEIASVLRHALRVATHLVLAEPMVVDDEVAGLVWGFPEWRHDYGAALKKLKAPYAIHPCTPVGHLNAVIVASRA